MKRTAFFFLLASPSLALADYNLMAPLGPLSGTVNLTMYVQGAIVVLIGTAGVLAVVMTVWCGIQLMGNPSVSQKSEAKACITNSILGVLLAAGAWIILNTINSQLVSNDFDMGNTSTLPVIVTPVSGSDPMPSSPGWYFRYIDGSATKNSLRFSKSEECISVMEARKTAGVTIVSVGGVDCFEIKAIPQGASETSARNSICGNASCVITKPIGIKQPSCSPPDINGVKNKCINVAGMPGNAISAIQGVQSACGCDVVITGGTENGHATHAPNRPIFDLRKTTQVDNTIKSNATQSAPSFMGCRYLYNGFWWTDEGDHWHTCAVGEAYWFCTGNDKSGRPLLPGKSPLCP